MRLHWGAVVAVAAILLSPIRLGADEPGAGPPHIVTVRTFLVAWGHERWDDLQAVAADAVTVTLPDKVLTLEPTARTSEVGVRLPFRGLATIRTGPAVTGVTVDELALRVGDQELRGPATVLLADEAGHFRVVGVSVDPAR